MEAKEHKFECEDCDLKFTEETRWRRHIPQTHSLEPWKIDESDETEEETEEKEISGKLIYIPVRIQEFQLYQKPNDDKSTVARVTNEATEVTSEETIKASDSEVENDTVRSDKKKEEEEPIILLSAPEHKPIGSNIILPNTYTHIETITSVQPTGKCASLKQNPIPSLGNNR